MFKGHHKGLYALALANTGERFGYYTMLAIFMLFLQAKFGWEQAAASQLYSIFLALVYFMPVVGGWLADKIGYGKCVVTGICVMFIGYLALSIPTAANGLGVALMTAMMLAWNYIVTPMYMGVPRQVVAGMLLPTFLPFNLVKGGLNAGITMLLYKPLSAALKKTGLLPRQGEAAKPRRFSPAATLISALVVVTCVVVFILMTR